MHTFPPQRHRQQLQTRFTTDDKIALFRRLFRGREDVYPLRWESAKGTSGYSPACGNEWKPGICPYWGNHFWANGYCVDTVGVDADMIRKYVRYQQKQEELQLKMKLDR